MKKETKDQSVQIAVTKSELDAIDAQVASARLERRGLTRSAWCAEIIMQAIKRMI